MDVSPTAQTLEGDNATAPYRLLKGEPVFCNNEEKDERSENESLKPANKRQRSKSRLLAHRRSERVRWRRSGSIDLSRVSVETLFPRVRAKG